MNGCPYAAGPACSDCDGSCWAATQPQPVEPPPCEWCSRWKGGMRECDGTCDTITTDQWIQHFKKPR